MPTVCLLHAIPEIWQRKTRTTHPIPENFFRDCLQDLGRFGSGGSPRKTWVFPADHKGPLRKPQACLVTMLAQDHEPELLKDAQSSLASTHRLQSSSFLGLPYRILNMSPQKGTTMEPMGKAKNSHEVHSLRLSPKASPVC